MFWPKTERQAAVLALAGRLADRCAARAERHDREGTFPHENFRDLAEAGYLALTIPREFGGGDATILEATLGQARLGQGDGSTALGASMHLSIMGRLGRAVLGGDAAELGGWDRARYERVARAVVKDGALINSAASEPDMGSPSRGGRPATTAVAQPDGCFVVSGRKTFTTMAPALRFLMVSATIKEIDGSESAGQFLLEAGMAGLRIEETWDTMGMRASGSHDLVLEQVPVPRDALFSRRPLGSPIGGASVPAVGPAQPGAGAGAEPSTTPAAWSAQLPAEGAGWALLIPAVYLGIGVAAGAAAAHFAHERRPQPLGGKSIGELPAIQRVLGEIEVALAESRALLFGVAEAWGEAPQRRRALTPLLAAAKYVATNRAVEVTDLAMRVVGGAGLSRAHPVQRYYRDVRAGLHHPPMDDVALATLAKAALAAAAH